MKLRRIVAAVAVAGVLPLAVPHGEAQALYNCSASVHAYLNGRAVSTRSICTAGSGYERAVAKCRRNDGAYVYRWAYGSYVGRNVRSYANCSTGFHVVQAGYQA